MYIIKSKLNFDLECIVAHVSNILTDVMSGEF